MGDNDNSDSEIPFQDDMHVVIVGGGYGGALLAVLLKKKNFCKVTLVDPKDSMIHCVASLRSCVEKGTSEVVMLISWTTESSSDIALKSKLITYVNFTQLLMISYRNVPIIFST